MRSRENYHLGVYSQCTDVPPPTPPDFFLRERDFCTHARCLKRLLTKTFLTDALLVGR